ncbi:MAG: hypothetical protein JO249_22785, partial [Acidobacteria bacterium]|nr:hypothetical protein [Acidobacteriota bacterium]
MEWIGSDSLCVAFQMLLLICEFTSSLRGFARKTIKKDAVSTASQPHVRTLPFEVGMIAPLFFISAFCGGASHSTKRSRKILASNREKRLASGSWWKLPMAAISCGDVIGSCGQIKDLLGGGDIQGPPAVDFAQRDL